ncbi:hypothetical protein A2Z33_00105 [Candidatus Gottesmanbacteria bacterium RBG_16_52_11]|uniref:Phosphatidic acid phosphatase type 2/haloperoxidase domain-containing protein n=1 Tax=Candidatus Gottesmanbacteria bacterium RBG_16_52_11 TaxID=1798374 RepID=A0A1F5YMZ8_9BACT|nr:MAG: hypothetical protein A2Z33_00105 [Candidatus Gottesmanbacteria bacterium RBG_16_52_11]
MRPDIWPGVLVIGSVPPSYAFPSGHATVAFAMAMVLSDAEPGFRGGFYLLAFGIAFSRVYLGVHYPLDVIAGSLLGTAIGWLILRYFRFRRVSSGRQKKSAIHR